MRQTTLLLAAALALASVAVPFGAAGPTGRVALSGNLSPLLSQATDLGPAPLDAPMRVVYSLQLRDPAGLERFLADVQDPASPVYHQFLTQDGFNARFGPTADQERAVVDFLQASGLAVTQTFSNRLLVEAQGSVADVQRAFGVEVHAFLLDGKVQHAALQEPSVPADLAPFTVGVLGLADLGERHPMSAQATLVGPQGMDPKSALGSNCCYFAPPDLNNAYSENHNVAPNNGAGQTGVIAGAYDFKDTDLSAFNSQFGLPSTTVTRVCVYGGGALPSSCKYNSQQSIEISLDIEYIHGTAPAASLYSYMAQSTQFTDFTTMENRVVTDNRGHSVSESWGACEQAIAPSTITSEDNVFANGAAVGQSWFFASGDDGSKDCNNGTVLGTDYPASSDKVTGVGGTHLTCSSGFTAGQPVCGGWGSETAWSGSGGGQSTVHARPAWQTGCGVPAGTQRLVPDVALEADTSPGNLVAKGGFWYAVGGTSDAAPQYAGMFTALNAAKGGSGLGLANARLYALCGGSTYHDVTSGSNGDYSAGAGYDMVTGLGTVIESNLLLNY